VGRLIAPPARFQFSAVPQLRFEESPRQDIESLGMRLKVINITAMPVVVAAFGPLHGWRRKKDATRA